MAVEKVPMLQEGYEKLEAELKALKEFQSEQPPFACSWQVLARFRTLVLFFQGFEIRR